VISLGSSFDQSRGGGFGLGRGGVDNNCGLRSGGGFDLDAGGLGSNRPTATTGVQYSYKMHLGVE
jgi:hypothetical protein